MTNSVDSDQLAISEANWSGSTLFVKAGHILVQQDQGYHLACWVKISADNILKYFSYILYFSYKKPLAS